MNIKNQEKCSGQGLVEYGLILFFLVLVVITILAATGKLTSQNIEEVNESFDETPIITPTGISNKTLIADFKTRIMDFYNAKKKWPRTFLPYNYTDIGLNPDDWKEPVNGLYWSAHGDEIGLSNKKGDDIEIYVKDLNGTLRHLVNGWNIWCKAANDICYFHKVAPGNEVDISSVIVIRN